MRNKGFTLIELLIYVSIFAVAGGMMFGILALILKVNQRESSTGEITSQMNFVSQTLSRLIRSSSNIEIDTGITTSTLKLRMKVAAKDPTCIYLDSASGIIKLSEGPDTPFNLQNCSPTASSLTNDRIKVDKLEFTKSTQYPGRDSVNMNIQMSYNSPNPGAQATREIKSASMRFSTAEFSDNILPSNDALYDVGTSTARWRNTSLSGNLLVAGNIGIGTTTPSEKLTVVDGNISQRLQSSVLTQIGALDMPASIISVYVSGKYAYTGLASAADEFRIIDISNPANPVQVGALDIPNGIYSVYVSGKYAYLGLISTTNEFRIIDISNPANPVQMGALDMPTTIYSVYVSGKYAYLGLASAADEFRIIDISNPANPIQVGVLDMPSDLISIYVSGKYAYIGLWQTTDEFRIIDISNPANPVEMGKLNMPNGIYSIYVSGKYAYIGLASAIDEFRIIDISNPANPVEIGKLNMPNDIFSVYVSGKYAYIGLSSATDEFRIIDISNPANPVEMGKLNMPNGIYSIYVSGKYAYIGLWQTTDEFRIIDISGLESVSGMIHSLEAGNLQVRNNIIAQGQLQITGGINVGTGGIFSAGPIGISISSTTQTNAVSAYFQGRVGIATTTPTQALEVNGGIRLFTSDTKPNCDFTDGPKNRGTLWHVQGANDQLQICAASSTTYAWRNL